MSDPGTADTEGAPAGAGPGFGEGPPPKADRETPDRNPGVYVGECRSEGS